MGEREALQSGHLTSGSALTTRAAGRMSRRSERASSCASAAQMASQRCGALGRGSACTSF